MAPEMPSPVGLRLRRAVNLLRYPSLVTGSIILRTRVTFVAGNPLRLGLNQAGFEVGLASNGVDAEKLLDSSNPDVVVMELRLPGVSGLELLNTLRARKPPIPVVAMSVSEALASEFEVSTYPKLKFLKKPVVFTPILEAVRSFLR